MSSWISRPNCRRAVSCPVASGRGHDSGIAIRQKGATLWAGRLRPGTTIQFSGCAFCSSVVAKGGAKLEGGIDLDRADRRASDGRGSRQLTAVAASGRRS